MMPVVIGGMLRTKGPAICVDANANSSLVAVHSAVMDLQRGVVHYAIVAGVCVCRRRVHGGVWMWCVRVCVCVCVCQCACMCWCVCEPACVCA